jgi:hypothetical protein
MLANSSHTQLRIGIGGSLAARPAVSKLAELLGAKRGDLVTLEVLEGRRPARRARIAEIFETYLGNRCLSRKPEFGKIRLSGARPYIRCWLHPDSMAAPER